MSITGEVTIRGNGFATLIAISKMSDMILYVNSKAPKRNREISNLTFNCNSLADRGLNLQCCCLRCFDVIVLSPINVGIYVNSDSYTIGSAYEMFLNNINIINELNLNRAYAGIGILTTTSDCAFINIVTKNMPTGIKDTSGNNMYYMCHCWCNEPDIFKNSIGIYNDGFGNEFISCYMDTIFKSFVALRNCNIVNCNFKILGTYYQYLSSNPYFLFSEQHNASQPKAIITATGCYFENADNQVYNPYISNFKKNVLINPQIHPQLFYTKDNISDYTAIYANGIISYPYKIIAIRINLKEIGVSAKRFSDIEVPLNDDTITYEDSYTLELLGQHPSDGLILNSYLGANKITFRFYNTTDSSITTSATYLLTITKNIDGSHLNYSTITK